MSLERAIISLVTFIILSSIFVHHIAFSLHARTDPNPKILGASRLQSCQAEEIKGPALTMAPQNIK
jgi:hypothetical protein